jgi:G3E family GTPase
VRARDGDAVSLTSGCVCCGLGGELMFALAGRRGAIARDRPWGTEPPGSRLVVFGLPGAAGPPSATPRCDG